MFGAKVSGSWQNGLAVGVLASAGDVIIFESFGWRGVVCPLAVSFFLSRFSGRGFWWAGNLVIFFVFPSGWGLFSACWV